MNQRRLTAIVVSLFACFCCYEITALAQTAPSNIKRTADGKPDLNGVWQVLNTASWDIQDHVGQLGTPPGQGVVEGNEIPYLPAAAAKKMRPYLSKLGP